MCMSVNVKVCKGSQGDVLNKEVIGGLANVVHHSRDIINCKRPLEYLGEIASAKALRPTWQEAAQVVPGGRGESAVRRVGGLARPE